MVIKVLLLLVLSDLFSEQFSSLFPSAVCETQLNQLPRPERRNEGAGVT